MAADLVLAVRARNYALRACVARYESASGMVCYAANDNLEPLLTRYRNAANDRFAALAGSRRVAIGDGLL